MTRPYLVHHLLRDSAERVPDGEAVRFGGRSLTYSELLRTSNALAHTLVEAGVEPGDRVGIQLPKSLEMLPAVYGSLAAGGAYVPIDPTAPEQRAAAVARSSAPSALVTTSSRAETLCRSFDPGAAPRLVVLVDDGSGAPSLPCPAVWFADATASGTDSGPPVRLVDEDVASITFTSGSTGVPKGVMVPHRALLTFADSGLAHSRVSPRDRVSGFTPLHFSLSLFEITQSVIGGACLVLVAEDDCYLGPSLARVIRDEQMTVLCAAPSVIRMAILPATGHDPFPAVRQVWFGGEIFPTKDVRELRRITPRAELIQIYGASETMGRTCYLVEQLPDDDDERIPLGTAFDNAEAIVIRPDGLPVRPGEEGEGELFMRGAMLMNGYWREPEKTAGVLVPNPLAPDAPGVVCKTGDIVRVRADGNLVHVGRTDDQVKSRGVRIELGDVDHALASHPDVVEGAAVAVPDDVWGTLLAACVVARQGSGLTAADLKRHVADRLPLAMVPSRVEFLDELPHTSTGKIDRKRLGELASAELAG